MSTATTVLTARRVTGLEPGSDEWLKKMSASKVAAALGLSPYESPFSLYFRMRGELPPQEQSADMTRGLYLEPAILAWFLDQHPELTIGNVNWTWQHLVREWQIASPDATALTTDDVRVGVEVKTSSDDSEWGEPGTDEIPVGYRAQVMWQMDTLGTRRTHIAMLSSYLDFREYVVEFDAGEADFIRERCEAFLADVRDGVRPSIDSHTETYRAVREMHPAISGDDVELSPEVAHDYCMSRLNLSVAEAEATRMKSIVSDLLGDAKRATFLGQTIAQRQAKGLEGVPYLVAGRNLPTFGETQ